ncbi:acetyltransferase [Candidatus Protofrankia californiensis]|uniref:acetyltransferase n=1 Tax=Candidatus Protofrankia californiensis TaxID=1839754 RepID=UPI001041A244|nr:acetyltransferase [Candidatus Protofrankia californiensis]
MTAQALQPLLLVGAGGFARETAQAVLAAGRYRLIGFTDDNPARHGTEVDGLPVIGGTDVVGGMPDVAVILCPGSGAIRAKLAARLAAGGIGPDRFATVVHPSVHLPPSCTLGHGSVLLAGVTLTTSVTVGNHVSVMPNTVLTHDDVVADFATICGSVSLAGRVHVGAGAYLGQGALVRENLTVGAWSTLGMGAVVLTDVPEAEVWVGNPARFLRQAANPPSL